MTKIVEELRAAATSRQTDSIAVIDGRAEIEWQAAKVITALTDALTAARTFINEIATTDTIITAHTLKAEVAKIDAALNLTRDGER
jgi:hypothetical protein